MLEKIKRKKTEEKRKKTIWQEILSWIGTFAAAAALALLVQGFLFAPIRVDGQSMCNTLWHNDVVLMTRYDYLQGDFERGDVVICRYPNRNKKSSLNMGGSFEIGFTRHTLFVKRLIALPGDTLEIREGVVYVNGEMVDESMIDQQTPAKTNYGPVKMGADEYFVMGDNRGRSNDSRSVGPISRRMIVGHVRFNLWPLNKLGQKVR